MGDPGLEREPDTGTSNADAVDGAFVAAEVASVVAAIVAFALHLDGSTAIAVPGGTIASLAAGFWLLGLAGVAAAVKARYRGHGTRTVGHAVLALGFFVLAAAGSVPLLSLGGSAITGGTVGLVVLVVGGNLVVLDLVR